MVAFLMPTYAEHYSIILMSKNKDAKFSYLLYKINRKNKLDLSLLYLESLDRKRVFVNLIF